MAAQTEEKKISKLYNWNQKELPQESTPKKNQSAKKKLKSQNQNKGKHHKTRQHDKIADASQNQTKSQNIPTNKTNHHPQKTQTVKKDLQSFIWFSLNLVFMHSQM